MNHKHTTQKTTQSAQQSAQADDTAVPAATATTAQIEALQAQVTTLLEREKRVVADYQNLVRRSQEDRLKFAKLAASEFVLALLTPLDHLSLAAGQLNDQGLSMVVTEFWNTLKDQGLEEIPVMGLPFAVEYMEAVETQGTAQKVVGVVSRGYRLNGEVLRHAKVVLGD